MFKFIIVAVISFIVGMAWGAGIMGLILNNQVKEQGKDEIDHH